MTSNAASTQPPRELAGLYQLLADRAPLVPGPVTGVRRLGAGYLAFSFHKMLAPSGAGVLYAGEHLLAAALPFLYGGDMIAAGRVFPQLVRYNALPWQYAAGTPDIPGAIVSARGLRLLLDLALTPDRPAYLGTARPLDRAAVQAAMTRVAAWRFTLSSTDGPVPHVTVSCVRGHHYRMAADAPPPGAPGRPAPVIDTAPPLTPRPSSTLHRR